MDDLNSHWLTNQNTNLYLKLLKIYLSSFFIFFSSELLLYLLTECYAYVKLLYSIYLYINKFSFLNYFSP